MIDVNAISWGLSALTVSNIWLLANKNRNGFLVGLAAQPVWVALDIMTGAYGLLPLGAILSYLYVKGYRNWGRIGLS